MVVLYRGRIVEDGPVDRVFATPRHPYTALLMASAPSIRKHSVRQDRPFGPRPAAPPDRPGAAGRAGRLRVRGPLPFAADVCAIQPPLTAVGERWSVACHRHQEWGALAQIRKPSGRTDPCPLSSSA